MLPPGQDSGTHGNLALGSIDGSGESEHPRTHVQRFAKERRLDWYLIQPAGLLQVQVVEACWSTLTAFLARRQHHRHGGRSVRFLRHKQCTLSRLMQIGWP